jgi:hypothetical protein
MIAAVNRRKVVRTIHLVSILTFITNAKAPPQTTTLISRPSNTGNEFFTHLIVRVQSNLLIRALIISPNKPLTKVTKILMLIKSNAFRTVQMPSDA